MWKRCISFYHFKLDPSGNTIWKQQSSTNGEAMDIILVDNSVYVAGISETTGSRNVLLQKYTTNGSLLWSIAPTHNINLNEYTNILKDNSGNIIINYSIADSINIATSFYTKKYDVSGSLIFNIQKSVPGLGWSRIESDNNDNIFILYNNSFTIEKFNTSGGLQWSKEFNPADSNYASNLHIDGNSNVYMIGTQYNGATANDFVTVKYNSSGVLQWSSFYNNDSALTYNSDVGKSVTVDANGNVYSTGDSKKGGLGNRIVFNKIIKYNSNGIEQWQAGSIFTNSVVNSYLIKTDLLGSLYVLIRRSSRNAPPRSDAHVVKYDNSGNFIWRADGYSEYQDHPTDMIIDNNMNVFMSSGAGNPIEGFRLTVVKFGQTNVGITNNSIPVKFSLSQNYPNPFNPSTNIQFDIQRQGLVSLKVYDFLGREIKTLVNESLQAGSYESTFDATELSSGIYFYRLDADGFTETKKMILLK